MHTYTHRDTTPPAHTHTHTHIPPHSSNVLSTMAGYIDWKLSYVLKHVHAPIEIYTIHTIIVSVTSSIASLSFHQCLVKLPLLCKFIIGHINCCDIFTCFESCFQVIFKQMKLWNIFRYLTFVNEKFCEQNCDIKCVVGLQLDRLDP